ncbi:ribosome recycling factor [Candidatus Falkowbacteria bacterium]|jgi:ribosome recycling factor|nr:ribosome recycling factor [Patescibacteria group bacterium]MDD3434974.1 ribosome recycling factor [Patescibacteria group bacterium]NCU42921.1 ribosome recycling factor [Candidatus Falkowbacteria bacterium]
MFNLIKEKESEFNSVLDFFKRDIASLRTGRANLVMLDGVQVEAYGVLNPLNAVANVSIADPRSFLITPWDKGVIKAVEKALVEANLGFGIMNEGDKIRLTIPDLTQENRLDLVKKLNDRLEKARISLRQVREEVKGKISQAFNDKEIAEDNKFRLEKELDDLVSKKNDALKEIRDQKEADIMAI